MSAPGRWLIVVLLILAAGDVDVRGFARSAQQAQRDQRVPARDRPAEAPAGTAVIAGVVVTQSEPQQPVRRVSVMLASGPVVIPRTAVIGAILMTAYLGGAVMTHLRIEDPTLVVAVVIGALLWAGLYLRDETLRMLVPLRKR